jgi:ABC-2 type transport system permease protein
MDKGIKGLRAKGQGKPFSSLLKMQFKVEYSSVGMAEKIGLDKDKSKYTYLYFGLVALGFIPLTVMLFKLANVMSSALISVGQPGLAVIMSVMAGQVFVVFMGLSHLMSSLYYSSDLEQLQSYPLTPWQIMSGKVLVVYAGQLVFALLTAAPFLVTLGVNLGDVSYWLIAPVVFLLIPAVPLAVGVLLLVPIMRLTARSRKRDLFRVLFGLVFFVFIMIFQYLNMNMARYGPEVLMAKLMERNGLVTAAAGVYPVLKWAAWALTGETAGRRLIGLLLYAGASAGIFNLVVSLSQRWFFGGIGAEVATGRKRPVSSLSNKQVSFARPRSPLFSIMLRDHRILVRTPNFFLTVLLNLLVVPLILLFGYIGGGQELGPLIEMGLGAGAKDIVILIVAAIHGMFTGLNQVASTAVSREGRLFWMSKAIPVAPRTQMRAKLYYSLLFSVAQLAVLCIVAAMLLGFDPARLLILAVLGILVSIPVSTICLLNDLFRPKLNWTEPQQAMKGNFQALIAGLFSMVYLGIMVIVIRGLSLVGISYTWLYAITAILLTVSTYPLIYWLDQVSETKYAEL